MGTTETVKNVYFTGEIRSQPEDEQLKLHSGVSDSILCVFSGVSSAGAPPAGDEPPAAAAGGAAGRSAGEEGRRDPGLQGERGHAQQRY